MNGRVSTELKPEQGRTVEEELGSRLALLDGETRFALLLWRLPDGVTFDRFDLDSGPTDYIQCAGGLGGRFTCEIRQSRPDGSYRQEVIGRASGSESEPRERVQWAEDETSVLRSEVLCLDEVTELFKAYLSNDSVPGTYVRRQIVF